MAERAMVFIDGNNWYHTLRDAGVERLGRLDYARISRKLLHNREWVGTRYYVGQVRQQDSPRQYADQRQFLRRLTAADPRLSAHLGRLEHRIARSAAAAELLEYLGQLTARIDRDVFQQLQQLGSRHLTTDIVIEKAVDVMLAVDLVVMAERNRFDSAYLLSADGDFTPAVRAVCATGKRLYAVSPSQGAELAAVATTFIRIRKEWLQDCYR